MNLILEDSKFINYYTDIEILFREVQEFQDHIYFISDLEVSRSSDSRFLSRKPFYISGTDLFKLVSSESIQFIWGVLSAFRVKPSVIEPEIPYSDGNKKFWINSPSPQANDAEFEIVCWDSSCTLFIGVSEDLGNKIKKIYPDIKDLDVENATVRK